MEELWPPALGTVSNILTVLSFFITIYVALQARSIRGQFFTKVRLREVLPELKNEVEEYLKSLTPPSGNWHAGQTTQKFNAVRGMLRAIKGKVSSIEKEEVNLLLDLMWTRKHLFKKRNISEMTIDECWELAGRMNAVVVVLDQKVKDLNWIEK